MHFDRSAVSFKTLHGKVSINYVDKINRNLNFSLYISLCITCDLRGGAIFRPHGHDLNKLGRGSLDDAT